jgi:RES domain
LVVTLTTRDIEWSQAWRIIASRFPPINLFERVSANPAVWEALIAAEQLTNPRVRNELGEIHLVPPNRRVSGPNASWVMAPFTHINPKGSRFSDGTYGIYYAAGRLRTAIIETVYHFGRFAADSNDPPRREEMRVLVGRVERAFGDVDAVDTPMKASILHKDSYIFSQRFGSEQRNKGSDGLAYPSVRHDGGRCIAAFWPDTVGIPVQERHLQYEWDGTRVSRYFDFKQESWVSLV